MELLHIGLTVAGFITGVVVALGIVLTTDSSVSKRLHESAIASWREHWGKERNARDNAERERQRAGLEAIHAREVLEKCLAERRRRQGRVDPDGT